MTSEGFAKDGAPWLGHKTNGFPEFVTFATFGRGRVVWLLLSGVENDVDEDWLSKLEREVEEAHHLGERQSLLVL